LHSHGWIVRAKMFDSLLVERGSHATENNSTLEEIMRLAEKSCADMAWDIHLVEKPLHGRQDNVLSSFSDTRSCMRAYLRKLNGSNRRHNKASSMDCDDDVFSTVTPSVCYEHDNASLNDDDGITVVTPSVNSLQEKTAFYDRDDVSSYAPSVIESLYKNTDKIGNRAKLMI
jgi:hypothetical protein